MKKWSENRIEKEMEYLIEDIPEHSEQLKQEEQLEKKIEMRIKRKVQKIIYRTICGIVLCILFLLIVIQPFLNAAFLNPKKLNGDGYGVMYQTLRDYFEVTRPYAELCALNVESKGFARYELQMQFSDRREPVNLGISNTWVDLEFGKYKEWKDVDLYTSAVINRFSNNFEDSKQFIEKVKELPSSAVLYLSVGDTNTRPLKELLDENVEIIWAEIDQPNVEFQGGIALRKNIPEKDISPQEMSEDQWKKLYLEKLENLVEHGEIWEELGVVSSDKLFYSTNVVRECYEDAKKMKQLMTKNYCISGKRDEIISYLENRKIQSLCVDEVVLCELNY